MRMRHSKGLVYIATLLAHPGRDISAVDLASAADGATDVEERERRVTARAGGELLDARARAAYRRRIEELQEELEEATAWSDTERASRARKELDFLAHELAAATGLGGRDRTFISNAERARQRVKKAITASLRRIAVEHADLGRHLTSTVHTGYTCRYEPDPATTITWQT